MIGKARLREEGVALGKRKVEKECSAVDKSCKMNVRVCTKAKGKGRAGKGGVHYF
jgi:hypothetical protein